MKVKIWDRIVLVLGALITLAVGVAIIVLGCQFSMTLTLGEEGDPFFTLRRIAVLGVGAFVVLYAVYVLFFPRKFRYNRHGFIVQQTDGGELRISVKAMENLVQKCIDMHEEINLENMRIVSNHNGVSVDLRISLANNISIPLAVASLQKQIKQYLLASSGIEVQNVSVSVETTGTAATVKDSPYVVPSSAETSSSEEIPVQQVREEKPKLSLHQRIFSKPEQPAMMPDAPKAEEEETQDTTAEISTPDTEPVEENTENSQDEPDIGEEEKAHE